VLAHHQPNISRLIIKFDCEPGFDRYGKLASDVFIRDRELNRASCTYQIAAARTTEQRKSRQSLCPFHITACLRGKVQGVRSVTGGWYAQESTWLKCTMDAGSCDLSSKASVNKFGLQSLLFGSFDCEMWRLFARCLVQHETMRARVKRSSAHRGIHQGDCDTKKNLGTLEMWRHRMTVCSREHRSSLKSTGSERFF